MFKNYWKIAFRNMIKQKVYSLINILGLLIGMTICILIFLWVQDELKYDRFHEHTEEIFRVTSAEKTPQGEEAPSLSTPIALGPELQASYPEIILSTRCIIYPFQIGTEKRSFVENMALVDPSFLQMFFFPLVKGDFQSALQNPNSIVLTESLANKYFGDHDPIGQTIKINNQAVFSISGVLLNLA